MVVICVVLGLALTLPMSAQGAIYLFEFDNVFGQGTAPVGPAPWVDAVVQDEYPGTVLLTITNAGLTGSEFTGDLFFNLNPSLDPSRLTFSLVACNGNFTVPRIDHEYADSYKAGGAGRYDMRFTFSTANAHRFSPGESLTYQITGVGIDSGLTAADFNYTSAIADASTLFYAAAHVQGTPPGGFGSAWISTDQIVEPVPEPALGSLLALGMAFLGVKTGVKTGLAKRRRRV